jgi:hypothetical protein
MNSPIITSKDKILSAYQPSIIFHSYINTDKDNNNIYPPRMPVILKDHSGQFAYVLAQEVRNLLGHINLSVEMLEPLLEDNDTKTYLGVIMRSSERINNLMNVFLTKQELDKVRVH